MLDAGRVQLRHGRAATPPAVAARSSKMPKSRAPEFRIKDGSRLHSGECAQSVDVLIPARRRGTRSRTHSHRPSCHRWRLQDWHPISRTQDPRCYLVNSCMAEPKMFDAKSIRRSHTGSRTEPGEPCSTRPSFGLIQRDNSRVGHWNSSTSMAKFLFQKP